MQGNNVGLLDIDIHGPSVPKLLHLEHMSVQVAGDKMMPVVYSDTLKVLSVGLLLRSKSDALIWRGPMKHGVIKQFVTDVSWGDLDYLVVDCPPGTGDEPLSIAQLLGQIDGAIIVTTPQQLAIVDVKKCITFCRQLNLPVLGVIENMSGLVCPHCNQHIEVFTGNGGEEMARDFKVPLLGKVPIDPALAHACDIGRPFVDASDDNLAAEAIRSAFEPLLENAEKVQTDALASGAAQKENHVNKKEKKVTMRIAIPVTDGKLSAHFGHCEEFAIVDVDEQTKQITNVAKLQPPAHEPGVLPRWLGEQNTDVIIAGGMGQRAQQLFAQNNIKVVVGASDQPPEELVSAYLNNTLVTGNNICDH
jgi:predicted Fe-Mo cluster-binding NifX family protein/MinD-like ATPase involved in chromosome partitioning or flagellar assembly